MAFQTYKLEVAAPATDRQNAFTKVFSPDSGNVISIEVELKKEKHRISHLVARIFDPRQEIFSALPDCAFFTIPVTLHLAKPGDPLSLGGSVFEGKVTQYQMGYPSPEETIIIAHEQSVDLRKEKKARTFKNVTSVQLADKIAKEYGFSIDTSELDNVLLNQLSKRAVEYGPELNDYQLIGRALAADGLELYTKGKKILIRQNAKTPYSLIFKRNQSPVLSLSVTINHVSSGSAESKQGPSALLTQAIVKSAEGSQQTEATQTGAVDQTHRIPPAGPKTSDGGAHHEEIKVKRWTNKIAADRRRKDQATLTLLATPDFGMQHVANLEGWGSKVDRTWWPESIKHVIVGSGEQAATTVISLTGPPSKKAMQSASLPFATADIVK